MNPDKAKKYYVPEDIVFVIGYGEREFGAAQLDDSIAPCVMEVEREDGTKERVRAEAGDWIVFSGDLRYVLSNMVFCWLFQSLHDDDPPTPFLIEDMESDNA